MNPIVIGIAALGGWLLVKNKAARLKPTSDPNWKVGKVGLA